jgi:hypothetical protein
MGLGRAALIRWRMCASRKVSSVSQGLPSTFRVSIPPRKCTGSAWVVTGAPMVSKAAKTWSEARPGRFACSSWRRPRSWDTTSMTATGLCLRRATVSSG